MKEGRKPDYPATTLGDKLRKMLHTTARRLKPQPRHKPAQQRWWQARKADVLTVTPHHDPVQFIKGLLWLLTLGLMGTALYLMMVLHHRAVCGGYYLCMSDLVFDAWSVMCLLSHGYVRMRVERRS